MIQRFRETLTRELHTKSRFRVAIVGAGPAGFYSAERLLKFFDTCQIDMYERLPAPFGLARYGVAPDHEDVKNCIHRFEEILKDRRVSFYGNVSVPEHITLPELHSNYHATILSYGATSERKLNILGECSESVIEAAQFVGWYNGHPDMYDVQFDFSNKTSAVIVGNGNVALDIARMLFKSPELLKSTDITLTALKKLSKSKIRDLYIIGRRGPLQSSFTSRELREICTLSGVNIHIDAAAFNQALQAQQYLLSNRPLKRLMEIFSKAIIKPHNPAFKNIHFLFNRSPTTIFSSESSHSQPNLSHIALSMNTIDPGTSQIVSSQPIADLPCHILFKSIGYKTEAISVQGPIKRYTTNTQVPSQLQITHSPRSNSLRNVAGRLVDLNGKHIKGLYASGWLKSGPVGVIASTMYNAQETSDSIIKDMREGRIVDELKRGGHGIPFMYRNVYSLGKATLESVVADERTKKRWGGIVTEKEWENIDRAELDAGIAMGKVREKVVQRDWLIWTGRGEMKVESDGKETSDEADDDSELKDQ